MDPELIDQMQEIVGAYKTMEDEFNLEELNREKTIEYLPAIIFTCIVIVLGVLGNAMSVVFYGFKVARTSTNFLISALAALDLVTCVVLVAEVIELCYSVNFRNRTGCKAMYFLNHWLVVTSGSMLLLIAIDRYRRICSPFARQITVGAAKLAIIVLTVYCFLLSFRNIFTIDVVKVNVTMDRGKILTAFYCTHTDQEQYMTAIYIFHMLDLLTFLVILVGACALYIRISMKIFRHRRRRKGRNISGSEDTTTTSEDKEDSGKTLTSYKSDDDKGNKCTSLVNLHAGKGSLAYDKQCCTEASEFASDSERSTGISISRSCSMLDRKKKRNTWKESFHLEKKVSLMMLCVFIVSAVSFVPHFALNLYMSSREKISEQDFNVGTQVALRLFMLNNCVNPYIMGMFNSKFRSYVKIVFWNSSFSKVLFCCRKAEM